MQELIILLAGHYLADFPLQPRHMLDDKQQALKTSLGTLTLIGHAMTHFLVTWALLGILGAQEAFLGAALVGLTHFLIDLGKIKGLYGVMSDQLLHYTMIALLTLLL